jgi:hypothetical protein
MRCAQFDLAEDLIEGLLLFSHIEGDRATSIVGEGAQALVVDFGEFRVAHGRFNRLSIF